MSEEASPDCCTLEEVKGVGRESLLLGGEGLAGSDILRWVEIQPHWFGWPSVVLEGTGAGL